MLRGITIHEENDSDLTALGKLIIRFITKEFNFATW